jgi:hypothetical protein
MIRVGIDDELSGLALDYMPHGGTDAQPAFRVVPIRMRGDGVQYASVGEATLALTMDQLNAVIRGFVKQDGEFRDRGSLSESNPHR